MAQRQEMVTQQWDQNDKETAQNFGGKYFKNGPKIV